ncbi:hypothetical protein F511_24326 [Dorcoceras hygrometricum]|uniref:Uncharacterized protein n=1 Tax=Dorcoceras hygrometricum TaxID=472368 RepID=A0A2Z7C8N6_9LAMI|nr:hypothetical protein F511_24326 [Dorcoceras hygrometricum]
MKRRRAGESADGLALMTSSVTSSQSADGLRDQSQESSVARSSRELFSGSRRKQQQHPVESLYESAVAMNTVASSTHPVASFGTQTQEKKKQAKCRNSTSRGKSRRKIFSCCYASSRWEIQSRATVSSRRKYRRKISSRSDGSAPKQLTTYEELSKLDSQDTSWKHMFNTSWITRRKQQQHPVESLYESVVAMNTVASSTHPVASFGTQTQEKKKQAKCRNSTSRGKSRRKIFSCCYASSRWEIQSRATVSSRRKYRRKISSRSDGSAPKQLKTYEELSKLDVNC